MVNRRTVEIGIHMALGAKRSDVIGMVLTESLLPVVIGLATGITTSLALSRVVESFLFGVSTTDPIVMIGATLLFLAISGLATAVPARRATRIDPLRVLRFDS
jgi:ABC-type antimicrobial peptide transport system permease subunit